MAKDKTKSEPNVVGHTFTPYDLEARADIRALTRRLENLDAIKILERLNALEAKRAPVSFDAHHRWYGYSAQYLTGPGICDVPEYGEFRTYSYSPYTTIRALTLRGLRRKLQRRIERDARPKISVTACRRV